MNRFQKIVLLIAKKSRKDKTVFEQVFFEFKSDVKKYEKEKALIAKERLKEILTKYFTSQGYDVEVKMALGKFRGHYYVSSAIILIDMILNQSDISKLEKYLQTYWSPKYRYKGMDEEKHKFNIR